MNRKNWTVLLIVLSLWTWLAGAEAYAPKFAEINGHSLRYAYFPAHGETQGQVVLLEGRATFIEYYSDVIAKLQERHFSVWVMDWYGQGGSSRPIIGHPKKQHLDNLDRYQEDLNTFINTVVRSSERIVLCGYSLGGFEALRYACANPGKIRALVLIAPMLRLKVFGFPEWLVKYFAMSMVKLGFGRQYVWGQDDNSSILKWSFSNNPFTNDPQSFSDLQTLTKKHPDFQVGGVTFGWVSAAFGAMDALRNDARLSRVQAPVLIFNGAKDPIIDARGAIDVCDRMPCCNHVFYPRARHEIFHDEPKTVEDFWNELDKFLKDMPAPAQTINNRQCDSPQQRF